MTLIHDDMLTTFVPSTEIINQLVFIPATSAGNPGNTNAILHCSLSLFLVVVIPIPPACHAWAKTASVTAKIPRITVILVFINIVCDLSRLTNNGQPVLQPILSSEFDFMPVLVACPQIGRAHV